MSAESEWNRWRGEQTAILKLVKEELYDTRVALNGLKKEFYIIKGKTLLFGALAGSIVSLAVVLITTYL